MHRVLSFQTARGFGESSEFITKRMCFSFLFSVGFLCILCGFLIGRFAAGRVIDIRTEKTRLRLAGNGLESTEHLRLSLIERLDENLFATSYVNHNGDERDVKRIMDALLDLQFFRSVGGNRSCITATVRGSDEPDRYVVLSGSGEGITAVLVLSRALKALDEDFDWQPRRTLKFMISLESPDACSTFLSAHVRHNAVAYIALNVQSIEDSGYFLASGSDIVQSTVLQAGAGVENPNYENSLGERPIITEACGARSCPAAIPRLALDIPNAALTFLTGVNESRLDERSQHVEAYRRALARIAGSTVWRLSEMTLFKWDPRHASAALIEKLQSLNSTRHAKIIDRIGVSVRKITDKIADFNEKINSMETTDSLEVRIANDLSMEVRRTLLCCDDDRRSRSDWVTIRSLSANSTTIEEYLRELLACHDNAHEILQEDVT